MTTLVRSYASVFLGFPHRTTRNYKALLKSIGGEIFNKDHKLEMYYVSAYAHYKLEYFFRSGVLNSNLKPARYHLLYLFRLIINKTPLPRPNSHEMSRYCETLMTALWDDTIVKQTFIEAARIINEVANGNLDNDNIRTEPFTKQVELAISNQVNRT